VFYHWDEMKIGPGAPPIKTDQGWLSIYHGVFRTMDGSVYRLGVALHDLMDPAKIIGVGDSWILQPEDPWEITGYVHNVVFTCGAVPEPDGTVKLYWGGADTVMCVAKRMSRIWSHYASITADRQSKHGISRVRWRR
jgi:predicted GH43/DUF377 family glycosyl hydrolase